MPTFQIASDLHLEFYKGKKNNTSLFQTLLSTGQKADILLLAGDIGYPEHEITQEFIKWCCASWNFVIWVYGNHEYYNTQSYYNIEKYYNSNNPPLTMEEKESIGYDLEEKLPNLKILLNESFEVPESDIVVIGSTVWTHFPDSIETPPYNDFKCIYTDKENKLTVKDMNLLHETCLGFLSEEIETYNKKKIVMVSHHLPSYTMIQEKFRTYSMNYAFASNLDVLLNHSPVVLWACGHSHGKVEKGKCVLNARGYPGEDSQKGYSNKLTIKI